MWISRKLTNCATAYDSSKYIEYVLLLRMKFNFNVSITFFLFYFNLESWLFGYIIYAATFIKRTFNAGSFRIFSQFNKVFGDVLIHK